VGYYEGRTNGPDFCERPTAFANSTPDGHAFQGSRGTMAALRQLAIDRAVRAISKVRVFGGTAAKALMYAMIEGRAEISVGG